jgi:hypothetical protein
MPPPLLFAGEFGLPLEPFNSVRYFLPLQLNTRLELKAGPNVLD